MFDSKSKNKLFRPHYWMQYIFYGIFKPLAFLFVRPFFKLRYRKNGFKFPKGGFLLLSNHHNNWDPIFINFFLPWRIPHFVANEEVFYNSITAFVFGRLLGQIKRGMSATDLGYIRIMQRYAKDGKVIGIYPEGDISMFGDTLPIDLAIAKLAKMLKLPIVLVRGTGLHLRSPRVAKYARRSVLTYTITDVLEAETVRNLSNEELHARIVKGIEHSENTWQKTANIKTGALQARAKWLEIGFFYCPKCHAFESFYSKNNDLYCRNCDFHLHANRYYRFDYPSDLHNTYPHPENSSDFDVLQKKALKARLQEHTEKNPLVATVDNIRYHTAKNGLMFKHRYQTGKFRLYLDRLEVDNKHGEIVFNIPMEEILSTKLQYKDVFEISLHDYRLRLYKKKGTWNGYLYVETLKLLLQKHQQNLV
ncbi:MAG: lysophospholipid acyltransferase family protein [Bacilli bacterium]